MIVAAMLAEKATISVLTTEAQSRGWLVNKLWYHSSENPFQIIVRPSLKEKIIRTTRGRKRKTIRKSLWKSADGSRRFLGDGDLFVLFLFPLEGRIENQAGNGQNQNDDRKR